MIDILDFQESLELKDISIFVLIYMASFMITPHHSPGAVLHLNMHYLSDWVSHNWQNKIFYDRVEPPSQLLGVNDMRTLKWKWNFLFRFQGSWTKKEVFDISIKGHLSVKSMQGTMKVSVRRINKMWPPKMWGSWYKPKTYQFSFA